MTIKERLHEMHAPNLHVKELLHKVHSKDRIQDLGSCSIVDMSGLNGTVSNPRYALALSEANDADLAGLVEVFPLGFHPISPFMKKALPDTPLTQQWWHEVHSKALADPDVKVLKVVDPAASNRIVGLCRYRLPREGPVPEGLGAGSWELTPWTEDHDQALCKPMVAIMTEERPKIMEARPHYRESSIT